MGALAPLFLLAGVAVAVPLYLHLFQRQEARRVSFPALRYLERTEREHARRIRFRQLLLLLVRVLAVLTIVGAGARLFLRGEGSAHPATALAIVLDNSMSSGRVVGEERVLDHLKALAFQSLDAAGDDDRIWVIRAGEPWLPAVPGTAAEARSVVEETAVSAARGDVSAALARAAELVATSPLAAREIHLLSDLQATGFDPRGAAPADQVPVVLRDAPEDTPANHAIVGVSIGGGLPPLQGQRSEIAIQAAEGVAAEEGPEVEDVPVRVIVDERVRGAGVLAPGAALVLPLPPAPAGWVLGYADADPDALRADDRRYFAYRARPAPAVAVAGDPGVFATEALSVLAGGGRARLAPLGGADAVLSGGGMGLTALGTGRSVVIVPPADPTLLPGLNRQLQEAGIPWRLQRDDGQGETELAGESLPEPLRGVRVSSAYTLSLAGDPSAPPNTLAWAGDTPWAVEGRGTSGLRYLLLGSALDAASTTLPVSAEMIRFLDWALGSWAVSGGSRTERLAGDALSAPREADAVRLPSGAVEPVDGTRMVRATSQVGLYAFLAGDSVVAWEAVNPPASESDLTPVEASRIDALVGSRVTRVARDGRWSRAIFRTRQGPELWRPLVLVALLLLLSEAVLASAGRQAQARRKPHPTEAVRAGS